MSYGVDYPNISSGNLYTSIDQYVATGSQTNQTQWPNGALNPPGAVYNLNVYQNFSQYAGFSSYYAPAITVLGTTATSVNVTSVVTTEQLSVGMAVSGSGVAAGTTISAIPTTTTLTLSKATTSSVTLNQLTFSYSTKIPNGFPPVVKYVRYISQDNPALNAYPSVVYYTDSTGTAVSGYVNEAYGVGTDNSPITVGNQCAGILLYNTTASGLSGSASATALNGNWCWIQVGGLCPGVACPSSTVIGDYLYAADTTTDAFTLARIAAGTLPTSHYYPNYAGIAWSNLSTNDTADILVNPALAQI